MTSCSPSPTTCSREGSLFPTKTSALTCSSSRVSTFFYHHASEIERVGEKDNLIIDADAPSAARVVYRYFGGKEAFPNISEDLLDTVDQADSAQYSEEDILAPEKWTLLNFIVDPRTGLEGISGFSIPHNVLL